MPMLLIISGLSRSLSAISVWRCETSEECRVCALLRMLRQSSISGLVEFARSMLVVSMWRFGRSGQMQSLRISAHANAPLLLALLLLGSPDKDGGLGFGF